MEGGRTFCLMRAPQTQPKRTDLRDDIDPEVVRRVRLPNLGLRTGEVHAEPGGGYHVMHTGVLLDTLADLNAVATADFVALGQRLRILY